MKCGKLQINELATLLNEHFQWNKVRMDCFVGMLMALIGVGTINLTQLALSFPSRAQIVSHYRRMQRFFSQHWLDYNAVARFIMKLYEFIDADIYLSLDRTNWKWGNTISTCWFWRPFLSRCGHSRVLVTVKQTGQFEQPGTHCSVATFHWLIWQKSHQRAFG